MVVSPLKSSAAAQIPPINVGKHNKRVNNLMAMVLKWNDLRGKMYGSDEDTTITVNGNTINIRTYYAMLETEIANGFSSLLIKKPVKRVSPPRQINNSSGFIFTDNMYDWFSELASSHSTIGVALSKFKYKFWKSNDPIPWNFLCNVWTQLITTLNMIPDPDHLSNIMLDEPIHRYFSNEVEVVFDRQETKYQEYIALFTQSGCNSELERNMKSCCERVIKILIASIEQSWNSELFDDEYGVALGRQIKYRNDLISRNKSPTRTPAYVNQYKESIYDELSKPMFGKYGSVELVHAVAESYAYRARNSINRMSMNTVFGLCKKLKSNSASLMDKSTINEIDQADINDDRAMMTAISSEWRRTKGSFDKRKIVIGKYVSDYSN